MKSDTEQPIRYQVHPTWWTEQYDSKWDRVREALRRDWEQTKADLSLSTGRDLRQSASHTVKQALGLEPLPLPHQPNPREWPEVESAVRYGFGAGAHFQDDPHLDAGVEDRLRKEWQNLGSDLSWDEIRSAVHHGWKAARDRIF